MTVAVGSTAGLSTETGSHQVIVTVLTADYAAGSLDSLVKLTESQADFCEHVVGSSTGYTSLLTLCLRHILSSKLEVIVALLPYFLTGVGLVTHLNLLGRLVEIRHITKHTGEHAECPTTHEACLAQELVLLLCSSILDILGLDGVDGCVGVVYEVVQLVVPVTAVTVGRFKLSPVREAVVVVVLCVCIQTYTRKHIRVITVGLTENQVVDLLIAGVDSHSHLVFSIEHTRVVLLVRVLLQEVRVALAGCLGKGHRTKCDDAQYLFC